MIEWLLDTNAVIALLNEPQGKLAAMLRRREPETVAMSAIVMHELYYGAFKSQRRDRNLAVVASIPLQVLDFSHADAREAGAVRASLALAGTPIGPYDVLIAGQARNRGLSLVTRNRDEFERVPGLSLVGW